MSSLLNRSHCKQYLLGVSEQIRGGKFTRVGADVYDYLDSVVRKACYDLVKGQPTIGKTLYSPHKGLDKKEYDNG